MNIIIDPRLQSYIDPLTSNELAALERSLLAEGCRDALVLWGEVLVDGHNRYAICQRHQLPFETVQGAAFAAIDDVMLWMIDNHLARRSVSDFQRGVLALRKKDIVCARAAQRADAPTGAPAGAAELPASEPIATREDIARVARVSSNTIGQIERIQKTATPELVQAVRSGTISINAAATLASLPQDEQVAAVAGGRKLLQQAARQVREQKAAARPVPAAGGDDAPGGRHEPGAQHEQDRSDDAGDAGDDPVRLRAEVAALKRQVASLTAQNAELSQRLGGTPPPWQTTGAAS